MCTDGRCSASPAGGSSIRRVPGMLRRGRPGSASHSQQPRRPASLASRGRSHPSPIPRREPAARRPTGLRRPSARSPGEQRRAVRDGPEPGRRTSRRRPALRTLHERAQLLPVQPNPTPSFAGTRSPTHQMVGLKENDVLPTLSTWHVRARKMPGHSTVRAARTGLAFRSRQPHHDPSTGCRAGWLLLKAVGASHGRNPGHPPVPGFRPRCSRVVMLGSPPLCWSRPTVWAKPCQWGRFARYARRTARRRERSRGNSARPTGAHGWRK